MKINRLLVAIGIQKTFDSVDNSFLDTQASSSAL